jgi:hypothetical protein
MARHETLRAEDCWAEGGRLGLSVREGGRVRLEGNREGLVGLARVLLWMAQYRHEDVEPLDLSAFASFEEGPTLELSGPR